MNKNTNTVENGTEKESLASSIFDVMEILVFAACFVMLFYAFVARLCRVSGSSMDQTLADGQMILVSDIGYEPKTGDIVVFHQTGTRFIDLNEPIVKRVIATAGQTVDIDFPTWTITITDTDGSTHVLDESKYRYLDTGYTVLGSDYDFPLTVPEGEIFVLGDNRNHSTDSRSFLIGTVDKRRILGKAIFRFLPVDKFGGLG